MLLKEIFIDMMENQKSNWAKIIKNYLKELDLIIYSLVNTTDLDKRIKEFDSKAWREEIELKTSLTQFIRWKTEIKEEEKLYGNGLDSAILFRARTNTLDLQGRKRINQEDTICPLCQKEEETLNHFILECEKLNSIRCVCLLLSKPLPEDTDDLIKYFLLFLTRKVLFLLSLATACRVVELQALSSQVSFSGDDLFLSYLPEFRAKTESAVRPLPRSFPVRSLRDFVGSLPDELLLCPVRALRLYLSRTASLPSRPRSLFCLSLCSFSLSL